MSVRVSNPRGSGQPYTNDRIVVSSPFGPLLLETREVALALERAREFSGVLEVEGGLCGIPAVVGSPRILAAKEAGCELGVPASWLLQRARERRIPFVQLGKYVRFDVERIRIEMAREPE